MEGTVIELDVFGRRMQIVRRNQRWVPFWTTGEGKRRRVDELSVPRDFDEDQVVRFVADLYHEDASPERPDVVRL